MSSRILIADQGCVVEEVEQLVVERPTEVTANGALSKAELCTLARTDRRKLHYRLARFGDDDFLTALGALDQSRKVRLGIMNVHRSHLIIMG